jgi:transcriptional regulator with XRE-family HTH domain
MARLPGQQVAVRDSRRPDGPVLVFTGAAWERFLRGLRDGAGELASAARRPPATAARPAVPPRACCNGLQVSGGEMFRGSGYGAVPQRMGDFRGWTLAGGHMTKAAEPVGGQAGGIVIPAAGGPTVLRIMLGAQLRRLREGRRITLEEAGKSIRASHSKMSRMETGRVGFKDRDIADLLTLYGVMDEDERETLRALARRANAPGWWHDYSDVLPHWFEAYVGLEEVATQIRAYEVQFVPGLLQTEDYARAVTLLGHDGAPPREIERRVRLRMARQSVLDRDDPPNLWAVIDEAVLRRPAGSPAVMQGQLKRLAELAERPSVTIQVIPFRAGGHAAAGGPFSILRFAEPDLPDIVYLEQLTSALYLDKPEAVDSYLRVMERICLEAATPADSTGIIKGMLNGH